MYKSTLGETMAKEQRCETYYDNANSLNLRSRAGSHGRVIEKLKRNTKVCISDIKGSWAYVKERGDGYLVNF